MVMWLACGDAAALRLGVVASKRSFHEAVERSRAKRLLREAYRLNRFRFSGRQDVILVARRAILKAARQDVERDLMALAEKAGMVGKEQ
jgi:ribonuclease P protein component